MPNKEFLEEYPLYKSFETGIVHDKRYTSDIIDFTKIPKPAIHMYCSTCGSGQTFNMINDYHENESNQGVIVFDKVVRALYLCSACEDNKRFFIIRFLSEKVNDYQYKVIVMKVGQYPAWEIKMNKNLKKTLGEHSGYYNKGLICESQNYGIGAYAYFRRITEDIIDELLESIHGLIDGEEKQEEYKKALENIRQEKRTSEKIDVVKDLLPNSLIIDGINPLKVLHDALSVGLHGKTDEDCMELSVTIRDSLVYLINQILSNKQGKEQYKKSLAKLSKKIK